MVSSKKGSSKDVDYSKMKVTELKALLEERGITPKGVKKVLIKMLEKSDLEERTPKKSGKKKAKEVEEEEVEEEEEEPEEVEEEEVAEEEAEEEEAEEEEVEEEEVEEEEAEEEEVAEEEPEEVEEGEEVEEEEAEEEEPEEIEEEVKPKPSFKKKSLPSKKTVKEPVVKQDEEPPLRKFQKTKSFKLEPPTQPEGPEEEGLFGTLSTVREKLCENRKALEVFSPKSEEHFQKLINDAYLSKSEEQLKKAIKKFAAFEECELDAKFTKVYQKWLEEIADYFLDILRIQTEVLEPRFDSSLGIYRIGDYAFQQDPEKSTSLVFAYVKDGKVVSLSEKTIKDCPKEYSLYHVYHREKSPPSKDLIKKIMDDTLFPRLSPGVVELEAEGDGISYPSKISGTEKMVINDLAKITIPEPSKSAFLSYRAAQRKYKSANYKNIAEKAGITEDDALFIASHFKEMEEKYMS